MFAFSKFVEVITVLQNNNLGIFGSSIYEYIFRCSSKCLQWKKYESLKKIVAEKGMISIKGINSIADVANEDDVQDKLDIIFLSICRSFRSKIVIMKKFNTQEYLLEFDSPFGGKSLKFGVEISAATIIDSIPIAGDGSSNEELMSSLVLYDDTFSIFRKSSSYIKALNKMFKIENINLSDPQTWGLMTKIGTMIESNTSTLHIEEKGFVSGSHRIKLFRTKGYNVLAFYCGSEISIPSKKLEDMCSICRETDSDERGTVQFKCAHQYHLYCILPWFRAQGDDNVQCPLCKRRYEARLFKYILPLPEVFI